MNPNSQICIVIPCYNEAKEFRFREYDGFLNNSSDTVLCFVNDGSTDNTLDVLNELKTQFPQHVSIISNGSNLGKAESIRNGIIYCNERFDHRFIGYVDADLSASLEECVGLQYHLKNEVSMAFGSRKMIKGNVMKRNWFRHIIGRFIAALISRILRLNIYDTQCGCKLFTKEESDMLFQNQFISRWLFDVEIFNRMIQIYGREKAKQKIIEIPMKRWVDEGSSKIKKTYFFRLWVDLWRISRMPISKKELMYNKNKN